MGLSMSARPRVRAVRNSVSPSGMALLHLARLMLNWKQDTAQVHSQRAGMEACIHEETGHGMRGDGLAVDGGDEHALMAAAGHALLAARAQKMGQRRGYLRALRLFGGQKDQQIGIAAAEPRYELPVAENYFGISSPGEQARCGFRVFIGNGKIGPA